MARSPGITHSNSSVSELGHLLEWRKKPCTLSSMSRSLLALVLVLKVLSPIARAADDIVLADFEGDDYAGWTATGEAFGKGPAHGSLPNQQQVDGFLGRGLVNSFLNGDRSRGTLTSKQFPINRDYLTFLIGGGAHEGK